MSKGKCKPRAIMLTISLEDVYYGCNKKLEYSRRVICVTCEGSGMGDNLRRICNKCTGSGVISDNSFVFKMNKKCSACNGEGLIVNHKCGECNGERVIYSLNILDIKINKGIDTDHRFFFPEQGDEFPNQEIGDIYVELVVVKHQTFNRKNYDLIYYHKVSLVEALTGLSFTLKHLNGKFIQLTYSNVITPYHNKKFVNSLGLPVLGNPFIYGKLIVVFEIIFPDKVNSYLIKGLKGLFNEESKICESYSQSYKVEESDAEITFTDEEISSECWENIESSVEIKDDKQACDLQ
jgi:DnaJ family protein A protein 2